MVKLIIKLLNIVLVYYNIKLVRRNIMIRYGFRGIKKVKDEEELRSSLKDYSGILDKDIVRYLDGLIDLNFNVVREDISDIDRSVLSQLDLYREILIYNVYNRSREMLTNLFESHKIPYKIADNENNIEGLEVYLKLSRENFEVFDFDYSNGKSDIVLSKLHAYTKEEKEAEMDKILKELEYLYDKENPYPVPREGVCGGPYPMWEYEHSKQIEFWQDKFTELDERKLTDTKKRNIEATRKVYEYLLNDFGLEDSDFEEKEDPYRGKIYVKSMPGLRIEKNIKTI